jgi:hypothetical protein
LLYFTQKFALKPNRGHYDTDRRISKTVSNVNTTAIGGQYDTDHRISKTISNVNTTAVGDPYNTDRQMKPLAM